MTPSTGTPLIAKFCVLALRLMLSNNLIAPALTPTSVKSSKETLFPVESSIFGKVKALLLESLCNEISRPDFSVSRFNSSLTTSAFK
jgi:hypothetical protein